MLPAKIPVFEQRVSGLINLTFNVERFAERAIRIVNLQKHGCYRRYFFILDVLMLESSLKSDLCVIL